MDHFTAIENAWLEPPQSLAEDVYSCELCNEAVGAGDLYIAVSYTHLTLPTILLV